MLLKSQPIQIPILDRMSENRIFYIQKWKSGFLISENCDNAFQQELTREELRQLGLEIISVAEGKADVETL